MNKCFLLITLLFATHIASADTLTIPSGQANLVKLGLVESQSILAPSVLLHRTQNIESNLVWLFNRFNQKLPSDQPASTEALKEGRVKVRFSIKPLGKVIPIVAEASTFQTSAKNTALALHLQILWQEANVAHWVIQELYYRFTIEPTRSGCSKLSLQTILVYGDGYDWKRKFLVNSALEDQAQKLLEAFQELLEN